MGTEIETSTAPGVEPSEEEMDFILKLADKNLDGAIVVQELEEAISFWMTYVENQVEFEEALRKYDADGSGHLSREQCRAYLVDLNGGNKITEEEFEPVFTQADVSRNGVIDRFELQKATALWYGYVES